MGAVPVYVDPDDEPTLVDVDARPRAVRPPDRVEMVNFGLGRVRICFNGEPFARAMREARVVADALNYYRAWVFFSNGEARNVDFSE